MSFTRLLSTSAGAAAAGLAGATAFGDTNRRRRSSPSTVLESEVNLAQAASHNSSLERTDSSSSALGRISSNTSVPSGNDRGVSEIRPPSGRTACDGAQAGSVVGCFPMFNSNIGELIARQ